MGYGPKPNNFKSKCLNFQWNWNLNVPNSSAHCISSWNQKSNSNRLVVNYLNDVVDFSLNEVKKSWDASFCRRFDFNGASTDGTNRLSNEIDVHFSGIPKIIKKQRFRMFFIKQSRDWQPCCWRDQLLFHKQNFKNSIFYWFRWFKVWKVGN